MELKEMTLEQLTTAGFEAMVEAQRIVLACEAIRDEEQDWKRRMEEAGSTHADVGARIAEIEREIRARAKEQARQG